jgi:hypothetical protein
VAAKAAVIHRLRDFSGSAHLAAKIAGTFHFMVIDDRDFVTFGEKLGPHSETMFFHPRDFPAPSDPGDIGFLGLRSEWSRSVTQHDDG